MLSYSSSTAEFTLTPNKAYNADLYNAIISRDNVTCSLYDTGLVPTLAECDEIFFGTNKIVDEKGICSPSNNVCEMGRLMRYLRLTGNGSNMNGANHIIELSYTKVDGTKVTMLDATKSTTI